jgi:hypothetical protein
MSDVEHKRLQEEIDKLNNSIGSLRKIIPPLNQDLMDFLAQELGFEKDNDEPWDEDSFFEAEQNYDEENAKRKAKMVATMINDIGEELSEEAHDIPEWNLLFSTFTKIDDVLRKAPQIVETLFSENRPVLLSLDLWREAGFLSHVAYRYQESEQAKLNPSRWLRSKEIEAIWNKNGDIGIQELYQQFRNGDFDF